MTVLPFNDDGDVACLSPMFIFHATIISELSSRFGENKNLLSLWGQLTYYRRVDIRFTKLTNPFSDSGHNSVAATARPLDGEKELERSYYYHLAAVEEEEEEMLQERGRTRTSSKKT